MYPALEFPRRGQVRFIDLGDPPEPGPTEVLIETCYTGVTNGTERHALLGEHAWKGNFPSRHGYQHVGTITARGDEVEGFGVGDNVFYGRYVGHRSWNIQDVTSPEIIEYDSHLVYQLPQGIPHDLCALLGVGGVAMRAVRRLRVEAGQKVWVAGAGPIGLFAAQISRAMGAEVTVSELIERRLKLASQLGAQHTVDANKEGYERRLSEIGPFDRIIDLCGARGLISAIRDNNLLEYRGAIGLIAVRSETCFEWEMFHGREASMEVSCHFGTDDLQALVDLVRMGSVKIDPLVTHREPISRALDVYALLRDHPDQVVGIIFDWKHQFDD
jgi:L-iditol 2-dehydrogenase